MMNKKKVLVMASLCVTMILPASLFAAENEYSSELVNNTKQHNVKGFKLVKTRMWPNNGCLIDTGKPILNPGESTVLKIKKDTQCNDSGVGYEIYRFEDTQNKELFGYLSHRLGDGKFSIQISRFCVGDKCMFTDLNPEQNR